MTLYSDFNINVYFSSPLYFYSYYFIYICKYHSNITYHAKHISKILTIISLLLFFFPVHTQTNETDVKKWKSGKLSQEDFKGQNTFKGIPSKDSIRLEITNGKEKYNGITYKYYKVENLFDRKNSYITDSANINAIRFAQLNYDLL